MTVMLENLAPIIALIFGGLIIFAVALVVLLVLAVAVALIIFFVVKAKKKKAAEAAYAYENNVSVEEVEDPECEKAEPDSEIDAEA